MGASVAHLVVGERALRAALAAEVAQLYMQGQSHAGIAAALGLTQAQVHKVLSGLFAEGMPKLNRVRVSRRQVRAMHAAYYRGGAGIEALAGLLGISGAAARRRMHDQRLPLHTNRTVRRRASSTEQAERYLITALFVLGLDEVRAQRGLSVERLAYAAGCSTRTLRLLRCELRDPRLSTVLRLCRALGVTPGALLPVELCPPRRHGLDHTGVGA